MPELPEVETVRRILLPIVKGKTIKAIDVYYKGCFKTEVETFTSSLIGETFIDVDRVGKFLIFKLTNDKVVISHLRMEGKYFEGTEDQEPSKHDIMRYVFSDGTTLKYNDVRKFGILLLSNEQDYMKNTPVAEVGKEPWDMDVDTLYKGLKSKSCTIKEALLDQTLLAGLGNIYDDEVCYATSINPRRVASSVTKEECASIIKEATRILNRAIENGGSTIKSYHPKEGVSGLMQTELLAYGRENQPCSRCGYPMRKISIGGRGTTYCPKCQIDETRPFIVGVTGPIASGKSTVSKYLALKGYMLIDADEIVSELYKDKSVVNELRSRIGIKKFDRASILKKVSENPDTLKTIEGYIHPLVYKEISKRLGEKNLKKAVLDIPLLIGGPMENECDVIITIIASENIQRSRVINRGKDPEKSLKLNKSWPKGLAKRKSAIVLSGDGSVDELYKVLDQYDW